MAHTVCRGAATGGLLPLAVPPAADPVHGRMPASHFMWPADELIRGSGHDGDAQGGCGLVCSAPFPVSPLPGRAVAEIRVLGLSPRIRGWNAAHELMWQLLIIIQL